MMPSTSNPSHGSQLRLAELMASFSLAIDLGTGQPMEWVIRCTLLGARLAGALNLGEEDCRDVYYLSLLRHIGCTANAHADAMLFGNEMVGAAAMTMDADDAPGVMRYLAGVIGKDTLGQDRPGPERAAKLARVLAAGPGLARSNHTAQCEVGQRLAAGRSHPEPAAGTGRRRGRAFRESSGRRMARVA